MKFLIAALLISAAPLALAQEKPVGGAFAIDAGFPGGNILVDKVEGDTVHLSPDNRDSVVPWFYWYFRVTGANGRKLTFDFRKDNDKNRVGVRGPGVSLDAGRTWKWLGAESVMDGTFSFTFPAEANEVRFSVGMPYLRADFDRWLAGEDLTISQLQGQLGGMAKPFQWPVRRKKKRGASEFIG